MNLDEYLIEDAPDDEPVDTAGELDAARVAAAIAAIDRRVTTLDDIAHHEMLRIEAWHERETEPLHARRDRLVEWLKRWHEYVVARVGDKAARTFTWPAATFTVRKQRLKGEVVDGPAFVAWAEEHDPSLIRKPEPRAVPDPEPDVNAIKAAAEVRYVDGTPRFVIELDDDVDVIPGVLPDGLGDDYTVTPTEREEDPDADQ